MKIGVVGDIHWSKYSSILRSRGEVFSKRLENCIESINWAESTTKDCDLVVYLGDFFDSPELNAEEISALNYIHWNDRQHHFLVGNHEMATNDLVFNSANALKSMNMEVIDTIRIDDYPMFQLCYIPYELEEQRKSSLADYFYCDYIKPRIVFSHNDLAGVQMGKFISKVGFDITDIGNNCDLFFNGHLHNQTKVTNKIIDVGNLTGQNFSEDGLKYKHSIYIVDTDSLTYEVIDNPQAIYFYKLDAVENAADLDSLENPVITLRCSEPYANYFKAKLEKIAIDYRVIIDTKQAEDVSETVTNLQLGVDHIEKFQEYVLTNIGTSDIIKEELGAIVNG